MPQKDYNLLVYNLSSSNDIDQYKELLQKHADSNIYYCFEHLRHFKKDTNSLRYFLLNDGQHNLVLMPFILRKIRINDQDTQYYDVVTQYGYSGPLLLDDKSEEVLGVFWSYVDQWYRQNNVITEFVRFSLDENHKRYTGNLLETLQNVRGNLKSDFDKQWESFDRKVRNNYRRALKHNLRFKVFQGADITTKAIDMFHEIYNQTMRRNKADSQYFYNQDYFNGLLENNINKFAIALVFLDETAVSGELIIDQNHTIYAYLGGTNSDYFHMRPNDFLRVEVVKWAINLGRTQYVLGGGIKNGDGLYKHKKAMFPYDKDVVFYTGRKVIDQQVYAKLCYKANQYFDEIPEDQLKYHFFPFYRAAQLIPTQD
ncbi:GNAT family N-acetyltransferase [Spongiivirga citrea]|uniref:GNAT family N-acetyltransferase n=1 Tax=Spongiivirga citrea TaxID=1481457 RepID=A0A6M0CG94_9FLAO|nr:GNAT family N-acetyltransferase [Spongiivirga citrea]NER16875.1 GNAT family N-acetyltransferase [Spongiivirga citrea]